MPLRPPPLEPGDEYDDQPFFEMLPQRDKDEYFAELGNEIATVLRIRPAIHGEGQASRLQLMTTAELLHRPEQAWTVERLIPDEGFTLLVGRNQVGKTFLGFDLACHISLGRPWFGRATRQTRVVYIAVEGIDTARISAWLDHHAVDELPDLRWSIDGVDLRRRDDQDRLIALVRQHGAEFVFLDTLNRSISNFDENGSKDMSVIIGFADRLRHEAGAGLIGIHHTPRDGGNPRGHTSLEDAADTVVYVTGTTNPRRFKLTKQRNGPSGTHHGFRILGHSPGGAFVAPVGSATDLDQHTASEQSLVQALVQYPSALPGTHKDLKERAATKLEMAQSTFNVSLKGLVDKGILTKEEEGKGTLYEWTEAGGKLAADISNGDGPT